MKRILLLAAVFCPLACPAFLSFRTDGVDPTPWTRILGSFGIPPALPGTDAKIIIAGPGSLLDIQAVSANHIVILEGISPESLGFVSKSDTVSVRQIRDTHAPQTQIIWEQPVSVRFVIPPADFQVFASEKWKSMPVLAGKRTTAGAILWLATAPGQAGYERYSYLLHALVDLGLELPLRTTNLWAFFDASYRIRADVDYLARRWRESGISALHVAAWHNVDGDPTQDEYLAKLIEACHRHAILVYAWLELPHVSENFWTDHPAWREKTAAGQDAQLDWRKLMNLQNPDCRREASRQIENLLNRFDWDGVNLAELYFESLEGSSNPARFTPMNDDVRSEFKQIAGFDPKLLFDPTSPYSAAKNPQDLRKFLDFRAVVAARMQSDWLKEIDRIKSPKPYLDVVLTHIDDRFEPGIRDELGADVARALPLTQTHGSTLLVEDPATLWNLGPERYSKLGEKYRELSPRANIAVDINVVERYQDVYPTKKQIGLELFELVHQAQAAFGRVALYFENSLDKQDLSLLPAAAASARATDRGPDEMQIEAAGQTRVAWQGPAELDGKPWPVQNDRYVLIPAGKHTLSPGVAHPSLTITDFNGDVKSVLPSDHSVDLSYTSRSRAIATLESPPSSIEIDGAPIASAASIILPAGQHVVTFTR